MSSISIYVDLDDVLVQTAQGIIQLAARLYGRRVRYEDLFSFDLAESFGLDAGEYEELFGQANQPGFLLALEPHPGARDCLVAARDRGAEIEIVTGRSPDTLSSASEWLLRHGFPEFSVQSVDKYGRHAGHPDSRPLGWLKQRKFDLAIEDSPETAEYLAREAGTRVFLLERPWNSSSTPAAGPEKVVRIGDWSALERQLSAWS